jgi:hypothetical protein
MAIELPSDWPVRGWVEEPPIGHLDTIPVDAPSGTVPRRWQVASWDTTREIASSSLPGQVRHQTGLSIGTGKALVKREQDDHPWNRLAVFDLSGLHAQILIAPEGASKIPTGQFRVAPVEGEMTTLGVQVDLDERQIEGASKAANVVGAGWVIPVTRADADSRFYDPAWLVQQLAEQMGYGVGVEPGGTLSDGSEYTPILDVPFQGSIVPAYPQDIDFGDGSFYTWAELDGSLALTVTPPSTSEPVPYHLGNAVTASVIVTADVYGEFSFQWENSGTGPGRASFLVENRTRANPEEISVFLVTQGTNGTTNPGSPSTTYAAGPFDPDRPYGIQIQFELIGSPVTSARMRVRRRAGAAWSGWYTSAMPNTLTIADVGFDIRLTPSTGSGDLGGLLSRVTVVDSTLAPNPDLLFDNIQGEGGRIFLEPLYGDSISTWLDPNLTVWGAMQAIVDAWQGALITDVYGNLRLMNRFSLTGVGTGVERSIDVGLNFEDLPWVMDYTDQADRLVVKYRPAVERIWEGPPALVDVLWEATDRIAVPGGGTREVFFTLDYIDPVALELIPFIRKDVDNGQYHVWDAWRYSNGTGNHIDPGDEIAMRLDRVSSSTWKIVIRNLTADPWFYMVDETATPFLKIRSVVYYDQTAEQTITRGVTSGESTSALEIDLSNYVQNAEDANALADFIWSRVNRRQWKAKTVTMVPDYRLDLGDVVELRHSRTRLRTNALVTKVDLAGEPGSVTQKVDLVLIPPTWEDFDEAWAGYTPNPPGSWAEFDALWATHTWAEFDLAPTATTEQQIQEYL